MIKKADGSTLYLTRDIAAAVDRWQKYKFDKMIYVVAAPQDHHFRQLFKILEMMGYDWVKKCQHINFGLVEGMSTRKGQTVFLSEILEEAKTRMFEVMKANEEKFDEIAEPEKAAHTVGLSAVFTQDMSAKRIKNYEFVWDRVLSSTGDTGPYLQYAHARLASILRKVETEDGLVSSGDVNFGLLSEPQALNLVTLISQYPSVLVGAEKQLEPSVVVQYLLKLCHTISAAYVLRVKGQEKELAKARLLLFYCAQCVLKNALKILGLVPLERM
eukprot:TRINITY_DN14897_c1_g1_i1.p1 TRINITY_DN14897_c1_g1~~TRINITY_DN14897_c1_g1_i1.p1  ORF type:complete len:284 (-),score=50.19 TRINITY_DN14897_c1_g1_i1:63-878(-)